MKEETLVAIINKFPMFDITWTDRMKDSWFEGIKRTITIIDDSKKCEEHLWEIIVSVPYGCGKHIVKRCIHCGAVDYVYNHRKNDEISITGSIEEQINE